MLFCLWYLSPKCINMIHQHMWTLYNTMNANTCISKQTSTQHHYPLALTFYHVAKYMYSTCYTHINKYMYNKALKKAVACLYIKYKTKYIHIVVTYANWIWFKLPLLALSICTATCFLVIFVKWNLWDQSKLYFTQKAYWKWNCDRSFVFFSQRFLNTLRLLNYLPI